jgi:Flp pilus assembly protein CpaB
VGLDAVPVPVRASAARLVQPGARIDLVATRSDDSSAPSGAVATGVRVLAVLPATEAGSGGIGAAAGLLVAADHATALRLAALSDTSPLAVVLPGS